MKVLHVNENATVVGGAERMLLATCALQQAHGHDVALLYADYVPEVTLPFQSFRVPQSGGYRSALELVPALTRVVAAFRPEVVHLHNTLDFLSPFAVRWLRKRVPTVKYVHDARLFCPRHQTKILARQGTPCAYAMGLQCILRCAPIEFSPGLHLSLRQAAQRLMELRVVRELPATLTGSGYMADELRRNGFADSALHIVPGFTERCPTLGQPIASGRTILAVGRFDAVKGMEDLVALLPRLRSPAWTATLVGDGWCLPQARELARRLGFAERVTFTGHQTPEELDRHFAAAALVVVPSRIPEAFGLAGIEAMAFAKPVVAYDMGGIRDWLRDGETGFLVPAGNIDVMSQCIDRLLDDPKLAARLGSTGRARVEQEFRPPRHLRALDQIYRRVCAAHDA